MPKPKPPLDEETPNKSDAKVVTLKADFSIGALPSQESASSHPRDQHGQTSEHWAQAIITLMEVERSRCQVTSETFPQTRITTLDAMTVPKPIHQGLAQTHITLRKERLSPCDDGSETNRIKPILGFNRPKS